MPTRKIPPSAAPELGMSISGERDCARGLRRTAAIPDYDLLRKNGITVKGQNRSRPLFNPYSYRGFKASPRSAKARRDLDLQRPCRRRYKKGKVDPDGPGARIQNSARRHHLRLMVPAIRKRRLGLYPRREAHSDRRSCSRPRNHGPPSLLHDAKPCSKTWTDPLAPQDWQGGLPIPYHLGGDA